MTQKHTMTQNSQTTHPAPNLLLSLAQTRYATKVYDPMRKIAPSDFETLLEIVRLSPSSVNSQPWRLLVADHDDAKLRIAKSMQTDQYSYNATKIMAASHVIVLATLREMTQAHLEAVTDAEMAHGRYHDRTKGSAARLSYVDHYRDTGVIAEWMVNQTHIALGQLLLAAASLGIDATPIGGFDNHILDTELGLAHDNLASSVVVALGYHAEDDFNAPLPKARLPMDQVVRYL